MVFIDEEALYALRQFTDLPFSHKSVVSITHEQNICRTRGGISANEKEGNTSNDNKQLLDEVEHDIMNYQNRGLDRHDTRF